MITGHSPRLEWQPNSNAEVRTIKEAVEIARTAGVTIRDDVVFFIDEEDELGSDITARGPKITKPQLGRVRWVEDLQNVDGKVPFVIRADILSSDEAIIAVIAHEMYELEALRPMLQGRGISSSEFMAHTSPTNPGNFHDEAWDVADVLIQRLRQEKRS